MDASSYDSPQTLVEEQPDFASGMHGATTDELLRNLPAVQRLVGGEIGGLPELAGRLAVRKARLSAIRARQKEIHAQLKREFERLHAERSRFEIERLQFRCEREAAAAAGEHPAPARSDASDPARPSQPDPVVKSWNEDADRLSRFFGHASGQSSQTTKSPESAAKEQTPVDDKNLDNTEIADSVADYVEQLLGRMRSDSAGGGAAAGSFDRQSWRVGASEGSAARGPGGDLQARPEPRARRRHNVHEIRAGVGSLREIANQSARTAVASHTSRKLRQSVAVTLPLTLISFVVADVLYFLGGTESKYHSQAFGAVMLGVIVTIELAHSFWKMREVDSVRNRLLDQSAPGEPITVADDSDNGTPAPGANQPQEIPAAEAGSSEADAG